MEGSLAKNKDNKKFDTQILQQHHLMLNDGKKEEQINPYDESDYNSIIENGSVEGSNKNLEKEKHDKNINPKDFKIKKNGRRLSCDGITLNFQKISLEFKNQNSFYDLFCIILLSKNKQLNLQNK